MSGTCPDLPLGCPRSYDSKARCRPRSRAHHVQAAAAGRPKPTGEKMRLDGTEESGQGLLPFGSCFISPQTGFWLTSPGCGPCNQQLASRCQDDALEPTPCATAEQGSTGTKPPADLWYEHSAGPG